MNVHTCALFALSLVLIPGPDPAGVSASAAATAERFPAALEGFTVRADSSLEDLLGEFTRVTNQNLSMDVETRQLLASTQVGLLRDAAVPAEQVYPFVETLLVDRGMLLVELHAEDPRLLGIHTFRQSGGRAGSWPTTYVLEHELDAYFEHPAVLISTVLNLPHVDVRQLGNSLRSLSPDPAMMQAIPLADTNSIILVGSGANIAGLARTLKRVDRAAEARMATAPPEAQGEQGEQGD